MDTSFEILWDVVEEHLDEAEFLWGMWEQSLVAPNYTLDEVASGPEERLAAHIDGLVIHGEPAARRLLVPALDSDEPGRISAAATALLLGDAREAGFQAVLSAIRELPEARPALTRALACAPVPALLPRLRTQLGDPELGAVAAEVLAFHFEPLSDALGPLLGADDPALRGLALQTLVYEPDPRRYVRAIEAGLRDPEVVDAAIDAGVRLGLAPAWTCARERAQQPEGKAALLLLALRGNEEDRPLLFSALQDSARRADALWALGFLGTPEAGEAALEWLEDQALAPLAGEVFTAVTGVDVEDENLSRPPSDDEERLDHRPEYDLPLPDPMLVLQRWLKERPRLTAGARYLAGARWNPVGLREALRSGPMRRRPAYLLALAMNARSSIRLQPRAPTRRQRGELSALNK